MLVVESGVGVGSVSCGEWGGSWEGMGRWDVGVGMWAYHCRYLGWVGQGEWKGVSWLRWL